MTHGCRLVLALGLAISFACGDTTRVPTPRPLPTPMEPRVPEPPEPSEELEPPDLIVGFTQDRIEIPEGNNASANVVIQSFRTDGFSANLMVEVGYVTASGNDVIVSDRVGIDSRTQEPVTTWVGMRALMDDVMEGEETFVIGLSLEGNSDDSLVVEYLTTEVEVAILDRPDVCSGIRIRATPPQTSDHPPNHCWAAYETNITVEVDGVAPTDMDFLSVGTFTGGNSEEEYSYVTILGAAAQWRATNRASESLRHDFLMRWEANRKPWEMRVHACAQEGRGPVLSCSNASCQVYAPGTSVPPPRTHDCYFP